MCVGGGGGGDGPDLNLRWVQKSEGRFSHV